MRIADTILNKLSESLVSSIFGGLSGGSTGAGGVGLFAALPKLLGFADGGFTGSGGKNDPAGIVHKGEVVWSQDDVRRWGGAHMVDAMRRGVRGYASGGIVGAPSIPRAAVGGAGAAGTRVVTIAPAITLNTNGGGTPAQNADRARAASDQVGS